MHEWIQERIDALLNEEYILDEAKQEKWGMEPSLTQYQRMWDYSQHWEPKWSWADRETPGPGEAQAESDSDTSGLVTVFCGYSALGFWFYSNKPSFFYSQDFYLGISA